MANAIKKEVPTIFLELSMDEAEALRDLVSNVTGDLNTSRRRFTDAIDTALYEADVLSNPYTVIGTIRFRDETDIDDLPF